LIRYAIALGLAFFAAAAPAYASCEGNIRTALDAMARGDDRRGVKNFNADLLKTHGARNLGQIWAALKEQKGDFRGRGASAWHVIEGRRYLFTDMTFAKGAYAALDACDAKGKIGFFEWGPVSDAAAKIAGAKSVTEPDGVHQQPMTVPSAWGPLPATLTLPKGGGPFPAVVLVAGAGGNDQDESIGPNKPFRDLALGLARAEVASLRYDKSITAYPSQAGLSRRLTVDDEVTSDALTALKLLSTQKQIDPALVFLLGHSLGAMMAPRIALRAADVAGVVMMGAPSLSILQNGIRQTTYLASVGHTPEATLKKQLDGLRDEEALLASHVDAPLPPGDYQGMPQSWWMSLYLYDDVVAAKAVTQPMLIVQGGGDFQVSPADNFVRWQSVFAGDPRVTLKQYPGLSHIFMPAGNPPSPEDYARPSHMDPQVIADIAQWIRGQQARK
jgi:hypothetical protein